MVLNNVKNLIHASDTHRHESYDPNGYVFSWNDRIFRAIYPNSQDHVRKLFDCGLIARLIDNGLFPDSHITEYQTSDCELVIEHKKIPVVIFPYEWSFSMLKDAALTVLRVNKVARSYGFQTLDAHGFNILFDRGRPVFVDLGSFIVIRNEFRCNKPGWRPYGEFMRSFYAPLVLSSIGEEFLCRHALYGDEFSMASLWRINSCFLRFVSRRLLSLFELFWYKYKALNTVSRKELYELSSLSDRRENLASAIINVSNRIGLPFSSIDFETIEKRIGRIRYGKTCHTPSITANGIQIDDRERYVLDFLSTRKPKSVLEIVNSSNFLCRKIASMEGVGKVVCASANEGIIDQLYLSLRTTQLNVFPMVFNFSQALGNLKFLDEDARVRSDVVIALDCIHSLILLEKLTLNFIMVRLRKLTNRYVVVEFKCNGLASMSSARTARSPEWYTLDWFRAGFEKTFDLIHEKKVDMNHVLFIGSVKTHGEDGEVASSGFQTANG